MNINRRHAVAAPIAAGLRWATAVPLPQAGPAVAAARLAHRGLPVRAPTGRHQWRA